jgi:hypothetical protein
MIIKEFFMKTEDNCTFSLQLVKSDEYRFVSFMLEEALYRERAHTAGWEDGEDEATGLAVSALSVEETERLIEELQSLVREARS